MKTKKLYCRIIDNKLEIGLASSGLSEKLAKVTKLEKPKTFEIGFKPSGYLELQKLKSLYTVDKSLIANLKAVLIKSDNTIRFDIKTAEGRKLAMHRLIKHINATPDKFKVTGIEERKNTKTGQCSLFLNYGLNYYLSGVPTSSYSVWLKNENFIPTGKAYHSNYLDLDEVHRSKNFDEVAPIKVSKPKIVVNDETVTIVKKDKQSKSVEHVEKLLNSKELAEVLKTV